MRAVVKFQRARGVTCKTPTTGLVEVAMQQDSRADRAGRPRLGEQLGRKRVIRLPAGWQPVTTGKTDAVDFAGF